MTDNTFNLDELNELKQAYQLIDEKLDGKEIVTPEQIRKASLKNISIFKRMYKFSTTWSLFAITPLLVLIFAFSPNMTTIGFWILGTYLVIDFLLHFLLMRRMKRVDHSELDLRTLLNEESFYNKSAFALTCVGFAFWIVFNYFFLGIIASVAMMVFIDNRYQDKILYQEDKLQGDYNTGAQGTRKVQKGYVMALHRPYGNTDSHICRRHYL